MRMTASAVERSLKVPVVGSIEYSDLGPVEAGYFIGTDAKGGCSLSVCILGHIPSIVARPVVLVNTEKVAKLRTNLIMGDGLL